MAHRKRLIEDPEFEKVEIARYLVNNLSLLELITVENMVKSGKLKEFVRHEKQSEQQLNNE